MHWTNVNWTNLIWGKPKAFCSNSFVYTNHSTSFNTRFDLVVFIATYYHSLHGMVISCGLQYTLLSYFFISVTTKNYNQYIIFYGMKYRGEEAVFKIKIKININLFVNDGAFERINNSMNAWHKRWLRLSPIQHAGISNWFIGVGFIGNGKLYLWMAIVYPGDVPTTCQT